MIRQVCHRRLIAVSGLLALAAAFSGCKSKDDLPKARSLVETALNSWKNGEDSKLLVSQNIEIVDPDWLAGQRLLDFTVKDAASQPQQGPRVVVVLNLQNRAGKKVETEVAYEVIMKDKIAKIGRDAFHVGK
jgi:hypothetical protein